MKADANSGHATCEMRLSMAESARLLQRAQAERVSASAVIETAWAILLGCHAECSDVLFGVTVSGRPPEVSRVDTIVGPFVNNVPRRVEVSLDAPVMAVCRRLHALQVDTQPFEHCSLERIRRLPSDATADCSIRSSFMRITHCTPFRNSRWQTLPLATCTERPHQLIRSRWWPCRDASSPFDCFTIANFLATKPPRDCWSRFSHSARHHRPARGCACVTWRSSIAAN